MPSPATKPTSLSNHNPPLFIFTSNRSPMLPTKRTCSECGFIAFADTNTNCAIEVAHHTRRTGERIGTTSKISPVPFCSQNSPSFQSRSCSSDSDRLAIIQQETECELFIQYVPTKSPSEHVDIIGQQQILALQFTQTQIQKDMLELSRKIEKATESRHARNVIFALLFAVLSVVSAFTGAAAFKYWLNEPSTQSKPDN